MKGNENKYKNIMHKEKKKENVVKDFCCVYNMFTIYFPFMFNFIFPS